MQTKTSDYTTRIIGLTQGANVDVFLSCVQRMRDIGHRVHQVGVVVSFAAHYQSSEVVKDFGQNIPTIKEWEIVKEALKNAGQVNLSVLRQKEDSLAPAAIWKVHCW